MECMNMIKELVIRNLSKEEFELYMKTGILPE